MTQHLKLPEISRRGVLASWRGMKDEWRLLEMKPAAIRMHEED